MQGHRRTKKEPKDSSNANAWYALGNAFRHAGKADEAIRAYEQGLKLDRDHYKMASNLAALYVAQKNFRCAYLALLSCKQGGQGVANYWWNLGYCAEKSGLLVEAVDAYLKTLSFEPINRDALKNLSALYVTLDRREEALHFYKKLFEVEPHNKFAEYFISIQEKNTLKRPPAEIIEALFDHYADTYDDHIYIALKSLCADYVAKATVYFTRDREPPLNVLDLGCGTGRIAKLLLSNPKRFSVTGIDLSQKMIRKAAGSGHYDRLVHEDIERFLTEDTTQWECIVASDSLNYFGELERLFNLVHCRLARAGLFVFTVEAGDTVEVQINGRYRHSVSYIHSVSDSVGFLVIGIYPVDLRLEHNLPVKGWLCVLSVEYDSK